MAQEL